MKRDDPERLEKRSQVDRTQTRLDVLLRGVAAELLECVGRSYDLDHTRELLTGLIHSELLDALEIAEQAKREYEPFRPRRRLRLRSSGRVPKPVKKTAAAGAKPN